jgi:type II secretion system protein E
MAFFKKLVPGKDNDTKSDANKTPLPGGAKSATIPAREAATPAAGKSAPQSAVPRNEQAASAGNGNALSATGEDGKRADGSGITDPQELATRLRPGDRLPDLVVGGNTDMLQMLSDQAGLDYVRLGDYPKAGITPELLRMIPSELARAYKIFPVELRPDGTIVVAISDPLNVQVVDNLRLMLVDNKLHNVQPVVANEEEIIDYINLFYGVGDQTLDQMVEAFEQQDDSGGLERMEGAFDLSDIEKISSEAPVIRFCNLLLLQAIKERASDVHIEPFSNVLRIRYRVDGVLREIPAPPKSWQLGIISRFKVMAGLDISESRRPQDGRLKLTIDGREIDMRLSALPVVHGECLVMRLLDKTMMLIGVQQIGMTEAVLERFMKIVERPNGILLVTGPTGSGKTTTLYAALNEINDPTEKIITTEDPVEYQLDGLVQININPNVGLTFARCLRAILRQDPDVILVGEIRDTETAQIAIQASLTGHLVFSTLHTNSAAATVTRLVDMGVEPFLITSTLEGIIAQRLVRTICANCKRPYIPTEEELADFGTTRDEVSDITFFKGEGCDDCAQTGYKGRLGIFELLVITDEIRDLILEKATTDDIQRVALEQGMKSMRQDGWTKICFGVSTFEEVAKHTPRDASENIRNEMESVLKETVGAVNPEKFLKPVVEMGALGADHVPGSAPSVPQPHRPTPYDHEAAMPMRQAGDAQKPQQ